MCTTKKFCCCCSLGTGVFIISLLNLLFAFAKIRGSYDLYIVTLAQFVSINVDTFIIIIVVPYVLAIFAVPWEKKILLIPVITFELFRICLLILFYMSRYETIRKDNFLLFFVFCCYSVIIEISYYNDLHERECAIVLPVTTGFTSLPQQATVPYPSQVNVMPVNIPQAVPEEYRTPAPYAHVQSTYPPQMPQPHPHVIPSQGLYYTEQSQMNASAPPFPYGAPPPYVPVQNSNIDKNPIV